MINLSIVDTVAGVWVAAIATFALSNWKKQKLIEKQSEFVDSAQDAVNEYIEKMRTPLTLLQLINACVEAQEGLTHAKYADCEIKEFLTFKDGQGQDFGKRLIEGLNEAEPLKAKLKSLMIRGQAYHFKDYHHCTNTLNYLMWYHTQLMSVATMLQLDHLNWKNETVLKSLKEAASVKHKDVIKQIGEMHQLFSEFCIVSYSRAYDPFPTIRYISWRLLNFNFVKNNIQRVAVIWRKIFPPMKINFTMPDGFSAEVEEEQEKVTS